jgi:hypothetical protein
VKVTSKNMVFAILFAIATIAMSQAPSNVEAATKDFMASNGLPGCVVIVLNNGQQIFSKGFGTHVTGKNVEYQQSTLCPTAGRQWEGSADLSV